MWPRISTSTSGSVHRSSPDVYVLCALARWPPLAAHSAVGVPKPSASPSAVGRVAVLRAVVEAEPSKGLLAHGP